MRTKTILCSMAALSMMAAFTSCSQEEPVKNPAEQGTVNFKNCDHFALKVGLPESEMKTRTGENPTMTYGEDGLWSFSRTIDRIWYAVYNNGNLLYHSEQPGVPQAVYDEDTEQFSLDIQIPKVNGTINLDEYSIFLFAGNDADKVALSEITDGFGLDFANKTMYAYPDVVNKMTTNGEMYDPSQYDVFVKYTTLDEIFGAETKGQVTLIRPFCQVTLLTDELCQPSILQTYATDGKVKLNSTPAIASVSGSETTKTLAYGWNYGTDELVTKGFATADFSLDTRAFNNADDSLTIPQEVTFKERKMFCVASYMMLAPVSKKPYSATSDKDSFDYAIAVSGDTFSDDAAASVEIPAAGIAANEKYVIYNTLYDPSTGLGGSGGIFSTHFALEIITDPTWTLSNELTL